MEKGSQEEVFPTEQAVEVTGKEGDLPECCPIRGGKEPSREGWAQVRQ